MKRNVRIRVSRLAERDLDSIWLEIAKRSGSPGVASAVLDSIVDVFALFRTNPEAGRERPEIADSVRSFAVESYIVYYRVEAGRVVIARGLHGMRDQRQAFQRK